MSWNQGQKIICKTKTVVHYKDSREGCLADGKMLNRVFFSNEMRSTKCWFSQIKNERICLPNKDDWGTDDSSLYPEENIKIEILKMMHKPNTNCSAIS